MLNIVFGWKYKFCLVLLCTVTLFMKLLFSSNESKYRNINSFKNRTHVEIILFYTFLFFFVFKFNSTSLIVSNNNSAPRSNNPLETVSHRFLKNVFFTSSLFENCSATFISIINYKKYKTEEKKP